MTTVTLYRDEAGVVLGFLARGHAGQAGEGSDIVCSAVSALTQTVVNALESVAGVQPVTRTGDGLLEALLPPQLTEAQRHDSAVILQTLVQGLGDIQASYPQYVRVKSKDWEGNIC
ncbi:MAG: ribosomal-processing cysteine protease Prp [Oscillospiraceae bacterium]|jgi:uncharacterized protein YsxB (DUF464 family)|nr:ribosomal-processing cysteine protease Prp [Oscillospiraceae bacterium]